MFIAPAVARKHQHHRLPGVWISKVIIKTGASKVNAQKVVPTVKRKVLRGSRS